MECPVCLNEYSAEAHQPKMLPCGHTACLPCLRQVPSCPECRQPFEGAAQALPTNFALLQAGGRVAEEWWCGECGAPAEEGCRLEHLTMPVQAALRRQALQLAPAAAEAAQGLGEAVRAAAAEPARAALQLLAEHQADAAADCRLSLRRGDAAFNAQCTLADAGAVGALARALVCALAAEGRLLRDEPQQEQPVVQQVEQQRPAQQQQALQQEQDPLLQEPAERPPDEAGQPLPDAAVIQTMNVRGISQSGPLERQAEKEQLLQRVRRNGMRCLTGLDCSTDADWALTLLRAAIAAGPLRVLALSKAREEHLRAASEAPGLRTLAVLCPDASLREHPPELPALAQPSTLRILCVVGHLPPRTFISLIRAHQDSLTHLLFVMSEAHAPAVVVNLLRGLARLRMLCLDRGAQGQDGHNVDRCRGQIEALRRGLPTLQTVLCSACDEDANRRFSLDAQNAANAAAPPNRG